MMIALIELHPGQEIFTLLLPGNPADWWTGENIVF